MPVDPVCGIEMDEDIPDVNEDGFEEIKLEKRDTFVTVDTLAVADNRETENS